MPPYDHMLPGPGCDAGCEVGTVDVEVGTVAGACTAAGVKAEEKMEPGPWVPVLVFAPPPVMITGVPVPVAGVTPCFVPGVVKPFRTTCVYGWPAEVVPDCMTGTPAPPPNAISPRPCAVAALPMMPWASSRRGLLDEVWPRN